MSFKDKLGKALFLYKQYGIIDSKEYEAFPDMVETNAAVFEEWKATPIGGSSFVLDLTEMCSAARLDVIKKDLKVVTHTLEAQQLLSNAYDNSVKLETLVPVLDFLVEHDLWTEPEIPSKATNQPEVLQSNATRIINTKAWTTSYSGDAHHTLLANINSSYNKDVPYSNSGAIIQSSGYGKSRTVDQLATLIPTIPMNVRDAKETQQGAFPYPDSSLSLIFESLMSSTNPGAAVHCFFALLFDAMVKVMDAGRCYTAQSLKDALSKNGTRTHMYQKLNTAFQTILGGKNTNVKLQDYQGTTAVSSLRELLKKLTPINGRVKLIAYVDDAHTLCNMELKHGEYPGQTVYNLLLKAVADYSDHPIFLLCLSTSSNLSTLAAPFTHTKSSRLQEAGITSDLVTPFTEMPFDCHPNLTPMFIKPGLLRLQDVQKFSFIVQFGRPLFWSYFNACLEAGNDEPVAAKRILKMAQIKLINSADVSEVVKVHNDSKLAILDTLLNLEYDPRRSHSHTLAVNMVAGNLRTVFSVPNSRTYMHTGYPSEPVLAEAALNAVFHLNKDKKLVTGNAMIQLYRDLDAASFGAIDQGEHGENIGKMILLLAYMAAVSRDKANTTTDELPDWRNGCSLVSFLEELTGEAFQSTVLNSRPDNLAGGNKLQDVFKNAWVRFTHFARAADDSAMTSSMSWVAFVRGMAITGWRSQESVDVQIPILLDTNQPIQEANISAILVQFKVRGVPSPIANAILDEKKIGFFPPPNSCRDPFPDKKVNNSDLSEPELEAQAQHRTRPFISLVMELGIVQPRTDVQKRAISIVAASLDRLKLTKPTRGRTPQQTPRHKKVVSDVNVTEAPSKTSARTSPKHVHPRYALFYHGCSHAVYKCIPNSLNEKASLKALLQVVSVFGDRPEKRPIGPVLKMKPFWGAGKNYFSWIDEPYFMGLENVDIVEPRDTVTAEKLNEDVSSGYMDVDLPEDESNIMDVESDMNY